MSIVAVDTDRAWRELREAASAPYRAAGRFAWHFARGKLGRDPVFRHLLDAGLLAGGPLRVVDLGCGQALLASLGRAMAASQAAGRWPAAWAPVRMAEYTGVELMLRDVERARRALAPDTPGTHVQVLHGDMREAVLPACDRVVILDVLHYVDHAAQAALLARVRAALAPGGRLLLRVGDQGARYGFAASQWVDHAVTRLRGHAVPPTWGRPLSEWTLLLQRLGFAVQARPMSRGTPFANVLLVADVPAAGALSTEKDSP